ncbi:MULTISPECIES: glutathione S-transferase family protein [unclassified Thioalkalivibrio]|uniref:glutathione S-transferase family protein n=1 Tax=unclassified Thioalkalivibrio TaxID=2621013 RepID=UPI000373BDF9|nr:MULTISPECIES: glutathione S-transferase family protein [unclassified Thioalkalivibrio]
MSLLINGELREGWLEEESDENGEFVRQDQQYRNYVTADGSAGPLGEGGYPAESGRYHLYVSYACPWAHRALILRKLKGLESHIGLSVVHHYMGDAGWSFDDCDGCTGDRVHSSRYMHELYTRTDPKYTGIVTVPVLFDTQTDRIVNNESEDLVRMFNSAFDGITGNTLDFYPEDLREEIHSVNERVYENVNNGAYRSGFATSQKAYDAAWDRLFETLDWLEERLARQPFLVGDRITEADWRLFTTLVRFDPVYYSHFKCNRQRIIDFPALSAYLRMLYQRPGVAETVRMDHIKAHYYGSHPMLNPSGIVPKGPVIDYTRPHDRPLGDLPAALRNAGET